MNEKNYSRRQFIGTTTLGAAALAFSAKGSFCHAEDLRKYEPNLRDRLWMWGHPPGSLNGAFGIKKADTIDMAAAIESMGIPNVCIIPMGDGNLRMPIDEYIKQFHNTKRVAWSVKYEEQQQIDELCKKLPNLVSVFMDDFFSIGDNNGVPQEGQKVSPAHLSLEGVEKLQEKMKGLKRDLAVVLYTLQLHPTIKYHIDYCDVVSFWTWDAKDLVALESHFKEYRKIVPDKPTLLGIYMWDFGAGRPITMELMKLQLDFALEKFKQGEIEGMIFHCTPLVDLGLEAVEYSRKWIAEYGDLVR